MSRLADFLLHMYRCITPDFLGGFFKAAKILFFRNSLEFPFVHGVCWNEKYPPVEELEADIFIFKNRGKLKLA
jgi:hypothetical protein